jgi:serine/alanine adding enzyme
MDFRIFSVADSNSWNEILDEYPEERQFLYFKPEYLQSWMVYEQAIPYCAYAKANGTSLIYPFLKKQINNAELGGDYYDIFTAYGYGGVMTNSNAYLSPVLVEQFNENFNHWCERENVVTEFIREMPFTNFRIRNADYQIVRKNACIICKGAYHLDCKKTRRNIRIATEKGLFAELDDDLESLGHFQELYTEMAVNHCFEPFYFFDDCYFQNILKYLKSYTRIINIKRDNDILASMLVFQYAKKASMHLACSKPDPDKCFPNDFLFYSSICELIKHGVTYICLGGGTTANKNDSLFRFKHKFSNLSLDVYIGKKVINTEVYHELIRQWEIKNPSLKEKYRNYFQKYRLG